ELLRLGDNVQRERCLTTGFRAVNFDDAPAREAAYTKSGVEREAARRDYADGNEHVAIAQAHDRALAVGFFDLGDRRLEHFGFFVCHLTPQRELETFCCCRVRAEFNAFSTSPV